VGEASKIVAAATCVVPVLAVGSLVVLSYEQDPVRLISAFPRRKDPDPWRKCITIGPVTRLAPAFAAV
jgi:hypothetical protein